MYFISVLYYKEKINNTVETPETNMEEYTFKKNPILYCCISLFYNHFGHEQKTFYSGKNDV